MLCPHMFGLAAWENPIKFISVAGGVVLAITTIVGILFGIGWHLERRQRRAAGKEDLPPAPPGLIKQKYLSWKNKYCPVVEYDGDE